MKKTLKKLTLAKDIQIILVVALVSLGVFLYTNVKPEEANLQAATSMQRSGRVLPDPKLTPGKADTLSYTDLTKEYNGQTYSQAHRNVPESIKRQVMKEYGNPTGKIEIDHFYPLCAGGSNDITNLWPETEHVMVNGEDLGFHTKDKLEAFICREVKAGRIDPKVAFQKITTDWVAYYHELKLNNAPTLGAEVE